MIAAAVVDFFKKQQNTKFKNKETHIKILLRYLRDRNRVLSPRRLEDKLRTLAQHLINYIVECDNRTGYCTFRFGIDSNEAIELDTIIIEAAE